MQKIKMLKTTPGAVDGILIVKFEQGLLYNIPAQISEYLANLFIKMGVAEEAAVVRSRGIKPPETAIVGPGEIKKETIQEKNQRIIDEQMQVKKQTKDNKPKRVIAMRVFNLSDELDAPWKEIIEVAKGLDIAVTAAPSGLTQEEVDRIKKEINK